MEYYQGYIRLNVSVANDTPFVIMDVTLDFSFDDDLLHIAKYEPESLLFKNGKFILGNLDGSKSKSMTVYFDPLMCSKGTDIKCNVTYKDYQGEIKISRMDPQELTVICPLMDDVNSLDCNSLNIGVLKSLLDTLPYHDRRISEIRSGFDIVKLANLSRDIVERRAVCHVRTLYTRDGGKCEMWYYGKTKVTKDEIIIKVSFIRADQTLEIFAATRNSEALTGLLAELGREIIDAIESKIGSKGKVVNVTIEKSDIAGTNLLDICNIDDTCDVMNVVVSKTRIDSATFSNSNNNNNNASRKEVESENQRYEEERLKREREDRLRYENQKAESNRSGSNTPAQHLQPPKKKSSNGKIFVAGAVVAIVGIIGLLILIASIGPSSEEQAIDENAIGDDYYDQGDYQSALEAYNNAIELDPENSTYYTNKGFGLLSLNQFDEASSSFGKALNLDSENADAWTGKGWSLLNMMQANAALDAFDKALDLDSENELALCGKGWTLLNMAQYYAASDAFDKALGLNSENSYSLAGKGFVLFNLGQYDSALNVFDKALDLNSGNAVALSGKGYILLVKEEYSAASDSFDEALNLNPMPIFAQESFCGKGWALLSNGEYSTASDTFDKALNLNSQNVVALCGKGWSLYYLGENDGALAAFNEALSIYPGYPPAQKGVNEISNAQTTNVDSLGYDYDPLESYILGGI